MTSLGEQLDLAGGWRDAWMHEARGPHGEWVKGAGEHAPYEKPDHSRLVSQRSPYKDPADHPFFQRNPVSAANIANSWEQASDDEKIQGMRWYADAHEVAKALTPDDVAKGAALLSAYSPQTSWPVNMLNATRAIRLGRAIGPGEGMITGQMQKTAQKILNGATADEALKSPKTNAFAHLIEGGGDAADDSLGKVVIDRHALSVAVGRRLSRDDIDDLPIDKDRFYQHVADQYRLAAAAISQREGRTISPHQVQAVTWLHQQDLNQEADASGGEGSGGAALGRGRTTMGEKSWEQWADTSEGIPVHVGTTLEKVAEPITAAEARGNSRPVSPEEFQRLAADGRAALRTMRKNRSPVTGLDRNWAGIKDKTYAKVQDSWGGATIDAHTGHALPDGADAYALSVKPAGMSTVSVPENASREEFSAAMDRALAQFRSQLENQNGYLGVFHDDENHRIDIDPVTVVNTPAEVESIGAYSHAIGGAFHFRTGDGYWPPHVREGG